MKNEIIITIKYDNNKHPIDIAVKSNIIIKDFISVINSNLLLGDNKFILYSRNHKKNLDPNKSFHEEKIWDGDFLTFMQ